MNTYILKINNPFYRNYLLYMVNSENIDNLSALANDMFCISYEFLNDIETETTNTNIEVYEIRNNKGISISDINSNSKFERFVRNGIINRVGLLIDTFLYDNKDFSTTKNIFLFERSNSVDYESIYAINIFYAIFLYNMRSNNSYLGKDYTPDEPKVGEYVRIYRVDDNVMFTMTYKLATRDNKDKFIVAGYVK